MILKLNVHVYFKKVGVPVCVCVCYCFRTCRFLNMHAFFSFLYHCGVCPVQEAALYTTDVGESAKTDESSRSWLRPLFLLLKNFLKKFCEKKTLPSNT